MTSKLRVEGSEELSQMKEKREMCSCRSESDTGVKT